MKVKRHTAAYIYRGYDCSLLFIILAVSVQTLAQIKDARLKIK